MKTLKRTFAISDFLIKTHFSQIKMSQPEVRNRINFYFPRMHETLKRIRQTEIINRFSI